MLAMTSGDDMANARREDSVSSLFLMASFIFGR